MLKYDPVRDAQIMMTGHGTHLRWQVATNQVYFRYFIGLPVHSNCKGERGRLDQDLHSNSSEPNSASGRRFSPLGRLANGDNCLHGGEIL